MFLVLSCSSLSYLGLFAAVRVAVLSILNKIKCSFLSGNLPRIIPGIINCTCFSSKRTWLISVLSENFLKIAGVVASNSTCSSSHRNLAVKCTFYPGIT